MTEPAADVAPAFQQHTGPLLIADISGYTAFLQDVAIVHPDDAFADGNVPKAFPLMSSLLAGLVSSLVPPFTLSKLEGDAVFVFADGDSGVPEGQALLDLLTPQDNRDPNAPPQYYLAQIEVTEQGMKDLADLKVQPGMPVDVIIKTGERTFFEHLVRPLIDSFGRAFRETD